MEILREKSCGAPSWPLGQPRAAQGWFPIASHPGELRDPPGT